MKHLLCECPAFEAQHTAFLGMYSDPSVPCATVGDLCFLHASAFTARSALRILIRFIHKAGIFVRF